MCFHARISSPAKNIEDYYGVKRSKKTADMDMELTYHHANGYSHMNMWAIPQENPMVITPMLWGLLPYNKEMPEDVRKEYYTKAARWGAGLNVDSEKLFSHFLYKHSVMTKRCIVPLNGFYEPHTCEKPKNYKVPYYFHDPNEEFVSLAGIYSRTPDGVVSFGLLTKEAQPGSMFATIHNKKNRDNQFRKVVPLDRIQASLWLDDVPEKYIMGFANDEQSEHFIKAYSISKDLFSKTIDSDREDIIERVVHPEVQIPY